MDLLLHRYPSNNRSRSHRNGVTHLWVRTSLAFLMALTSGCAGLLPSVQDSTGLEWTSFDNAKQAFDEIRVGVTSRNDLDSIGFGPNSTPNVEILTYVDLTEFFLPNPSIGLADLAPQVRDCVTAKQMCTGYRLEASEIHRDRQGNVFLDALNFRRHTLETGWRFRALVLIKGDEVVYKLWSGEPRIDNSSDRRNPLGPLQKADDILVRTVR